MKPISKVKQPRKRRAYESVLRDEQADATRTRILEGLVRTMAKGIAGLSIPAVARESGVSIPTVYRYFPSKAALVAALGPHLLEKTTLMELPDSDDIGEIVMEISRRQAGLDDTVRAAMASELGNELRRATMSKRLALVKRAMARTVPALAGEELERFTRFALIAMSSATFRAYKDYLGLDAEAAGEDIAWAMRRLAGPARAKRS